MLARRKKIYLVLALLVILWNLVTYLFITSRDNKNQEFKHNLTNRIKSISKELNRGIKENQSLLEDINKQKAILLTGLQKQVPSDTRQDQQPITRKDLFSNYVIPILLIACNRPTAVQRSLDLLIRYRPSEKQFPIIVSQDCGDFNTAKVIETYKNQITYIKQPNLDNIPLDRKQQSFQGYYKIARHYKFALGEIFNTMKYDAVIIVEDDLDIAVDFYEYFLATYPLLKEDPTLWCVSAWNDNGKRKLISDENDLLYRSDFFPGLGWMISKEIWSELEPKWPLGFWDDWMRQPEQRNGRACLRPEISRTDTFGRNGVSMGQFFDKHLKFIQLNDKPVKFTERDLSYLKKDTYDKMFLYKVYNNSKLVSVSEVKTNTKKLTTVRIQYESLSQFKSITNMLGIMSDLKSGVPRTAYMGIVTVMFNDIRIYLAPPKHWKGYDLSWS